MKVSLEKWKKLLGWIEFWQRYLEAGDPILSMPWMNFLVQFGKGTMPPMSGRKCFLDKFLTKDNLLPNKSWKDIMLHSILIRPLAGLMDTQLNEQQPNFMKQKSHLHPIASLRKVCDPMMCKPLTVMKLWNNWMPSNAGHAFYTLKKHLITRTGKLFGSHWNIMKL